MKEIWKDIKGYEGYYQVSDQGRVKSLARKVPNGEKFYSVKEKILKLQKDKDGYNQITLYLSGNKKTKKPYKLAAVAFLNHKPGEDGLVVDHKYPPNTDDRLSNLQLITTRENLSKDKWRGDYSSRYVGVSWYKKIKKWVAKITIGKKYKHLGYFNTELEAYEAYQKALKNL